MNAYRIVPPSCLSSVIATEFRGRPSRRVLLVLGPFAAAIGVACGLAGGAAFADEVIVEPAAVRRGIERAIPLLEAGARGSSEHRPQCFTCHNQGMPLIALTAARRRGIAVNEPLIDAQLAFIAKFLEKNRSRFLEGNGTGGEVATAGTALWALEAGGWPADDNTAAVAKYLLGFSKSDGHWIMTSNRPPSEHSHFTATYLAIRALSHYGSESLAPQRSVRFELAKRWLVENPPRETEDRVFRLWALKRVGEAEAKVAEAREDLLKTQREDGGWSQTPDLTSDAYATGSALVALREAGELPASDARIQCGVRFLLQDQLPDGSWRVVSRSKPFQTYFESGFPHGKDQFISITATAWGVTALALACQ